MAALSLRYQSFRISVQQNRNFNCVEGSVVNGILNERWERLLTMAIVVVVWRLTSFMVSESTWHDRGAARPLILLLKHICIISEKTQLVFLGH
jgi:hypothetical protein